MLDVDVVRRLGAVEVRARLAIGDGVTVLFGRSGAGKTTLVQMIAGVLRPDAGRLVCDGSVWFDAGRGIDVPTHRRRVGYVFQDARLLPHLTVRQNLLFGWWFTRRADRRMAVDHVVELLGLGPLLPRRPRQLSGGEQQRVAIGRALLQSPRLLVLDEPLASIDRPRRLEVLALLERLRDELRIRSVYVTHSVRELMRLADQVVVMRDGRVVDVGTIDAVAERPEFRRLTGSADPGTVLHARVAALDATYGLVELAFPGGRLVLPDTGATVGARVRVRIRARDVAVALDPPSATSVQNVLRGTVVEVRAGDGPVADVVVEAGGTRIRARITRRAADQLALAPGRPVFLLVKAVSIDRRGTTAEPRRAGPAGAGPGD